MRPLCRICNSEHFAREPHAFKVDPKPLHEVLRVALVVVDSPKAVVDTKPVTLPAVVDKTRKADRHAKVRTEYFREQKRRKRAEKQAAVTN